MGLVIRQRKGGRGGAAHTIGDEVERVVLGRDPARCQVVFAADETAVGREHCALERVLGRYRVVLTGDHLVTIDGRAVSDGEELPEECELQLGPGGPRILVRTTEAAGMPETVHQGHRPGTATRMVRAEATGRRNRLVAVGVLAVALVASGLLWWKLHGTSEQVEGTRQDLETTRSELQASVGSVQGRLEALRDELHVVRGDIQAMEARAEAERNDDKFARVEAALAALGPGLRDGLREARPSVCLVIAQGPEGAEQGVGTAWVVAPGRLATNAHVAEVLDGLASGWSLAVRGSEPPHATLPVRAAWIHPGYTAFEQLWQGYEPVEVVGENSMRQVQAAGGACDVAILDVDDPDGHLGPPLPLVSDEEAAGLEPGDAVGYVGYPMERLALGGTPLKEPSPTAQIGAVTVLTDFFGSDDAGAPGEDDRYLVQNSCPGTGGASGSPLLDAHGRVIGLMSAVSFAFVEDQRVPSGVGISYAQRVDLLRELLEDRADASHAARWPRWEQRLQDLYRSGYLLRRDASMAGAVAAATTRFEQSTQMRRTVGWTSLAASHVDTLPEGEPGADDRTLVATPLRRGPLLVMAVADRNQPFRAWVEGGTEGSASGATEALEALGPGILAQVVTAVGGRPVTLHAVGLEGQGVPVELSMQVGAEAEITPDGLRERVLGGWIRRVSEARGEAMQPQLVGSTAERLGSGRDWSGWIDLAEGGMYYAIAVAPGGEDIDLQVRDEGTNAELAVDRYSDHYPVGVFQVDSGLRVGFVVNGPRAGIEFQLHLYRAVPAP